MIGECEELVTELEQAQKGDDSSLNIQNQKKLVMQANKYLQDDDHENTENDLFGPDKSKEFFDQIFLMPKHLSKFFLLEESNLPTDPNLKKMISELKNKGIQNQSVLDVFKSVDRKYFLNAERDESDSINAMIIQAAGGSGSLENPYKDVPKQIGWGTTISAPSMHAETLQYLHNKLSTAHTVLDIGTGSGFITAAMAQLIPDQGTVYAVDHIQEINDFAQSNIKKVCPHLIRKGKVAFIT